MKKFILRLSFFVLPIVVLAFPLDLLLGYYLKKSSQFPGEIEVWNDIYNSRAYCDIAVYGSSRAWVHMDSQVLSDSLNESVYNFGIDGHNFWLQYLRHKEFFKHNTHPNTIIISVDEFSLAKRKDLYQPNQFLPFMLWNNNIKNFTSTYLGYKDIDYWMPLVRYFGKLDALIVAFKTAFGNGGSEKYRTKGYKGIDLVWNQDLGKAKAKMQSLKVDLDVSTIKLFETFINEVKQAGIKLIFVYTPVYSEGQSFISNRNEILAVFDNFSKKYNVIFMDFSTDEICWNKSLFYNSLHLNKTGSELFSKKLASRIKKLNLK